MKYAYTNTSPDPVSIAMLLELRRGGRKGMEKGIEVGVR